MCVYPRSANAADVWLPNKRATDLINPHLSQTPAQKQRLLCNRMDDAMWLTTCETHAAPPSVARGGVIDGIFSVAAQVLRMAASSGAVNSSSSSPRHIFGAIFGLPHVSLWAKLQNSLTAGAPMQLRHPIPGIARQPLPGSAPPYQHRDKREQRARLLNRNRELDRGGV